MIDRIVPLLQDGHILIPKTCEYVALYDKRTLHVKLRILRWREYPGVPNGIISFLKMKEEGRRVRGDVAIEAEVRVMQEHEPSNVVSRR